MNNNSTRKPMKKSRFVILVAGLVTLALVMACIIYLSNYYHADLERIENFTYGSQITMSTDADGNLVFIPDEAENGFIFYPGGKVEYTSYIPLMETLASKGTLCILVEMPFHLAVFDIDAADGLQELYPEIENWYIGGHSLGGSMAASYLSENSRAFEGLILLGSYSTADLSGLDIDVLSVYGSEDLVLNKENYNANISNLPSDFHEVILDGGCHAFFGMYGPQDGDGIPTITNEEQIDLTAESILNLF